MRRFFATLSGLLFLQQIMLGGGVLCGVASANTRNMMSDQRSTASMSPAVTSASAGHTECTQSAHHCGFGAPASNCQSMTLCTAVAILSTRASADDAAPHNDAVLPAGRPTGPLTRTLAPEPPPPRA